MLCFPCSKPESAQPSFPWSSRMSIVGLLGGTGAATASNMAGVHNALSTMTTPKGLSPAVTTTPPLGSPDSDSSQIVNLRLQSTEHCVSSLRAINAMRQNSQLCDVVLRAGSETIPAHRVVLASVSPYFHAMFNDDLAEKDQEEVTLHSVDAGALLQLIDYLYTGEILISEDNVQVLLPASSILQINSVREACCKFLMRQLHPANCLGIRSFADAHSCKELHKRSHIFALQNFQQVVATEEFLLLPCNEVEELVSNSQLNISSEEQVFSAVISWLKHDLPKREKDAYRLLRHVRLPLTRRDFLMSHVDREALMRCGECKELLLEAMRYHLAQEDRAALATQRTEPRRPCGLRPYIFAIGGGSLFAIHSECECYDPEHDKWFATAPMLGKRSRAGVEGLDRYLYVIGGYDGGTDLATGERYDPQTNTWSPITPMGTKRSCLGVSSMAGLVYACGGYDGSSCLGSVERFDPLAGIWTSCPAMNTRRRYCRLAALDNCIYALGGFDSSNYQSSVERLDPRTGLWEALPAMTSRRSSCGVAALNGFVYCVGGNDGTMCMSSGERFNPRSHTWEPIASMNSRRSTHEVVSIDRYLYAVGGNDGSSSLNNIERYEPTTNRWMQVSAMLMRRSSVGAAVLHCLDLERTLRVKC